MSGRRTDDNGRDQSSDYTFGYGLGAGYTYKFSPAWELTADWKLQSYQYNFNVFSTTLPEYGIKEKISSLGIRLSNQF